VNLDGRPGVLAGMRGRAGVSAAAGAPAAFDRIAERYDEMFTSTTIGRLQRAVVWDALARAFEMGDNVLELNCGTGEDAFFLARRGVWVTACDASQAMIEVARRRQERETLGVANLEFQQIANEDLGTFQTQCVFDGAFSNFSGLNCVEDMREVAAHLGRLVRPGARLLVCFSTRICAWEILWYLSHAAPRKAFRRVRGYALARVDGISVPVWYPTLREIRRNFAEWFRVRSVRAVGLLVPPSYVEPWAERHERWMVRFARLDQIVGRLPILRGIGDHALVEMERLA
jgi:ubiquinone/menaquinone biosynthesis C-methylase UbiE